MLQLGSAVLTTIARSDQNLPRPKTGRGAPGPSRKGQGGGRASRVTTLLSPAAGPGGPAGPIAPLLSNQLVPVQGMPNSTGCPQPVDRGHAATRGQRASYNGHAADSRTPPTPFLALSENFWRQLLRGLGLQEQSNSIRQLRWRSESPPTVFVWLTRAVLSRRPALTGPILGTATSRSNTCAVDTCSGGRTSICSMLTLPSRRSCFSFARAVRTSFARPSAIIRRSYERIEATAETMAAV